MPTIHQYNQELIAWDFEKERLADFLSLLSERNRVIIASTPETDFFPGRDEEPKNEVFVSADASIAEIAFHLGFPHQRKLCALIDKDTGNPCNEGVFFSLRPEDVFALSKMEVEPETMVYFLNTNNAQGARVQTKYSSSVISRWDLEGKLNSAHSFEKRKKHAELNRIWIGENTIPFNIEEMLARKENYPEWLIVPDPIYVRY